MFNTQRPSKIELLSRYEVLLAQNLIQLQKADPGNIEKHDPIRLELQAVMHHLRNPEE